MSGDVPVALPDGELADDRALDAMDAPIPGSPVQELPDDEQERAAEAARAALARARAAASARGLRPGAPVRSRRR
ncbi:MAG TPA: hypothetical protein VKB14_11730, partial [Actinomycetales bacterium]|nr:hypothetical protein [Actinomycetales bacterium]